MVWPAETGGMQVFEAPRSTRDLTMHWQFSKMRPIERHFDDRQKVRLIRQAQTPFQKRRRRTRRRSMVVSMTIVASGLLISGTIGFIRERRTRAPSAE